MLISRETDKVFRMNAEFKDLASVRDLHGCVTLTKTFNL